MPAGVQPACKLRHLVNARSSEVVVAGARLTAFSSGAGTRPKTRLGDVGGGGAARRRLAGGCEPD
jgi:hypothetical protein